MMLKKRLFNLSMLLVVTLLWSSSALSGFKDARLIISKSKEFSFNNGSIVFSSRLESGRLNVVEQESENVFSVIIGPENTPINDSAWYAFTISSKKKKEVIINFNYTDGTHRYHPKISLDGQSWDQVQEGKFIKDEDSLGGRLQVEVGPGKTWIAAQELNYTVSSLEGWMESEANKNHVTKKAIGKSVLGNPIAMLEIGASDSGNTIALLGRQHPPEITGTKALLAFVERLTADSPLAVRFRKHFKTLVIPLMNPDGVINGHWRHNVYGVDLNRDWYTQKQPEVIAAVNVFKHIHKNPEEKLWFAVDFHSTNHDVFYTVERDLTEDNYKLVDEWLEDIITHFPGYDLEDQPGSLEKGVAKNWFLKEMNVPALTYEVGDNTPDNIIVDVGHYSAEALMKLLLGKIGVDVDIPTSKSTVGAE